MIDAPFRLLVLMVAGWLNEDCRKRIEFLEEQLLIYQEIYGSTSSTITSNGRIKALATNSSMGFQNLLLVRSATGRDSVVCWVRTIVRSLSGSSMNETGRAGE